MHTRHARLHLALLACLAVPLAGCADLTLLALDLRTDYLPGEELAVMEIAVWGQTGRWTATLHAGELDWTTDGPGHRARVLEVALPPGRYELQVVALRPDGGELARGRSIVDLGQDRIVSVPLTRTCTAAGCESCAGGQCRQCSGAECEESPPACVHDADCPVGPECTAARCVEGECFRVEAGGCATDARCDLELGCVENTPPPSPDPAVPAPPPVTCATGYLDCDPDVTGCETYAARDPLHCGACGARCPALPHATSGCWGGMCGIGVCDDGWTNANGLADDGCETEVLVVIGPPAPSPAPEPPPPACAAGTADCDGDDSNGCEADLSTDESHCGACGDACVSGWTCHAGECMRRMAAP